MVAGVRQQYDLAGDEPFNVGTRQEFEGKEVVSRPPIRTAFPRRLGSRPQ